MRRDHLDDAIDSVAARLTRVTDDDALATKIISALPERAAWFGWKARFALAAVALAATIGVVLQPFDDGLTNVQTNVQTSVQTGVPTNVQTSVPTNIQTHALLNARPNDRSNARRNVRLNDRPNDRLNDRLNDSDHERSLAAIAPPAVLSLKAVAPSELPGQGMLTVEPLAIADLPLTAETISPR